VERVLFAPRALPILRPNVVEDPSLYSTWVTEREEALRDGSGESSGSRTLVLVMIIGGEPPPGLIRTLESLEEQTSGQWSLLAVLHRSWEASFTAMLAVSGLRRSSRRVRTLVSDDASGPHEMFDLAAGALSDLALIFPGDVWAPSAVSQLGRALRPGGVAYADEDCLGEDGSHDAPRLKPAYSPEFLLHSFYTGRPMAVSAEVVAKLPRAGSTNPAQFEHDLALRACEVADTVVHVPEVLCHRVAPQEVPARSGDSDTTHIVSALQRRGDEGEVTTGAHAGSFRIRRSIRGATKVSIIIPFRDEPRFLRTCIESIDATKGGAPLEFVLVDNGSVQPETATLIERLGRRPDTHILTDARSFNWAALNNVAARQASGDIFLFLNNDIEAPGPGWLGALCTQADRPEVGAVGARLLYPDHRLQHCGVVVGLGGAAGHLFVGLPAESPGYLNMAVTTRECAGVTGACLATRRQVYESLGGFDETLGVDLNDIDYCLRALRGGLRILYEPEAELIHHESPSRGTAGDVRDIVHFIDRWSSSILDGDPYLHPALTRVDSSCALRGPGEEEWWQQWRSNLSQPT
jgi:O-antigen biosynthesis protein